MTIEKERIEAIKRDTDLVALVQSKGIELKKNGKSYHGLCPFHDETNPLDFPQKSRHGQAQSFIFCFSYSEGHRYPSVECLLCRL